MNISTASVKRPVTTFMIVLVSVILGMVSLTRLKMDLMPSMNLPYAAVVTTYTGTGPQEMETLISKPLEQALGTTPGLKDMISYSSNGMSMILMQFSDDTDMNYAMLDCREQVDLIKAYLPSGANDPMVLKMNMNSMPINMFAITSEGDMDLVELNTLVEDQFQPELEKIEGVASVGISGGREKEISIEVLPDKLKGYGVSVEQITGLLASENLNKPIGTIMQGDADLSVKTVGEFTSIEDIRGLPITTASGATVYLRDLANVSETFVDQNSYAFVNGNKAISLSIQKQSDANTTEISKAVFKQIKMLEEKYEGIRITTIMDQSEYIEASVSGVANSALLGGVFAVIVLFLFLRNVRSTLIVGTAMPVSIIFTLFLMDMAGITLNVISLGGLALGVGMLVDSAIVVLENIFTHRQQNKSRVEAAIDGAKEIGMAVIASTLTTVAVFLPMIYVEGLVGQIFKELALTVTFSLIASLLVALTWVPMASSKILKISKFDPNNRNIFKRGLDKWGDFIAYLDVVYKKVLGWSLHHKLVVVVITLVFFIGTLALVPTVGMEFFSSGDEGTLSITVTMPRGTQIEETVKATEKVVSRIEDIPEIEEIFVQAGSSGMISLSAGGGDSASITVTLVNLSDRKRSTADVVEEVRGLVADIPGPEFSIEASSNTGMSAGTGADISLQVFGDDLDELDRITQDFKRIIEGVDGTREVTTSLDEGTPEAIVRINRDKASIYAITVGQVASTLSTAVSGSVATQFKVDGTEIDIRVRQNPENINYITDIGNISIQSPRGGAIPLYEIAEIVSEEGPVTVTRLNQRRYVTVSSGIYGRDLGSVSSDILAALDDYIMPSGYSYNLAGTYEEMMESFISLGLALMLAIVLVYMVMASQFESLRYPFIVMMAVPISLTGGIFGLVVTRTPLSVVAFVGLIMLAGIVVNNGIVLVDYINQLRQRNMTAMEAIIVAGPSRLRPILMTTLTTVLALVPMVFNTAEGGDLQRPLAIVVVFGLSLSTLVTLIFIPIIYAIMDDLKDIMKRYLHLFLRVFRISTKV